jgi:hypothetical protein
MRECVSVRGRERKERGRERERKIERGDRESVCKSVRWIEIGRK